MYITKHSIFFLQLRKGYARNLSSANFDALQKTILLKSPKDGLCDGKFNLLS